MDIVDIMYYGYGYVLWTYGKSLLILPRFLIIVTCGAASVFAETSERLSLATQEHGF